MIESGSLLGYWFDATGNGHVVGNALTLNYFNKFRRDGTTNIGHCSGVVQRANVVTWNCKDTRFNDFSSVWTR
jgi:hypothetical protein